MTQTAEAPKAEKPKAVVQNGVARPSEGTKTARIWAIADEKSQAEGKPAARKSVLDAAVAESINVTTAATQYGRWRKFHGLGKEAAPAAAAASSDAKVE